LQVAAPTLDLFFSIPTTSTIHLHCPLLIWFL
jgi:hypothetical protein